MPLFAINLDSSSNDEYTKDESPKPNSQCYPLLPPFTVPGTRNLLIITGA